MTRKRVCQLKASAAIIPANVSTSPMTSIGTRLLPEYGSACILVGHDMCTMPSPCSCLVASKSFAGAEHDAVRAGDAEFEARRDPPRAFDEMRFRLGRTELAGGLPRTVRASGRNARRRPAAAGAWPSACRGSGPSSARPTTRTRTSAPRCGSQSAIRASNIGPSTGSRANLGIEAAHQALDHGLRRCRSAAVISAVIASRRSGPVTIAPSCASLK